ncbi:hypothetical protein RJT34_01403 [Clitoria ternatea]|uniref:Clu domain-containing protein n=1 Tax=Clitoria ternatea TaxID=43366 RepID=A0AAN9PZU2_CLITE
MAGKPGKGRGRRNTRANSNHDKCNHNHHPITRSNASQNITSDANKNIESVANVTENDQNRGDPQVFPSFIKTLTGEKIDLHLGPGDAVWEIRQVLLDSKDTCYVTCYDLLLHTKDGRIHYLEDFIVVSDVTDITAVGFFFEMVPALYDDKSIRVHVRHTRELLTLSNTHTSFSTSLSLQYGKEQHKAANSGDSYKFASTFPEILDTSKNELPELDGLGYYMEDVSGLLGNLLPSPLKRVKCVESILFSSFNPPPRHRRLVGDLLYLDVISLEGSEFCVTGSTKMFYVNSCTGNTFDPRPSKANFEATSLAGLLQKISPKFKKAFREILEQKASVHPFENVQSMLLPSPWLGSYPVPEHSRDSIRAENSLTLLCGSEPVGMPREWNEELQTCRELPHTTPQERMLRDRALYKVSSDFVDAAINGAIGVINGCIPPVNSTDPEHLQMFLHNNIFFSVAVDTDLQQLSKKSTDANSKPWNLGTLYRSSEKSSDCQVANGGKNLGSGPSGSENQINVVGVAHDTLTEFPQEESDVATYASANNDLNGTKAFQEADVPGLHNLAVAIIDYRGHRVLAQSVLPGILQGDSSGSLLYGSLDNGKKISWNEEFHSKVLEAAKHLHLKEHSVLDGSGNVSKLAVAVDSKGIVGSDNRHYLLDLVRVTPRDANCTGPASRFCILRPELISSFCQAQAAEKSKSKKTNSEFEDNLANDSLTDKPEKKTEDVREHLFASAANTDLYDEIVFNPNVFTEFKLAGSPEEIAADENNVRKASLYLTDIVISKFIEDLCTSKVSPMDGQTLTEALHAHGINVRYIGKVADGIRHLPHLWDLCINEIVVRSSKHIINDIVRDTEDHDVAPAISHLFNCLFGSCQAPRRKAIANGTQSRTPKREQAGHQFLGKHSKGQGRGKGREYLRNSQPLYMSVYSEALWFNIQEFARMKYKLQVNLLQFELPEDARSSVKKISVIRNLCLKVGITLAAHKYDLDSTTPFQTSDILGLWPIVKHSIPVSSEAKELVETGKLQFAEVTGLMHREVANCCRYCNMALFYHGLNQTELSLRYMSRALILLNLSSGPDHPDIASTFINVAMMYQDMGRMDIALRYLQEALKKNERLLGQEHIQTALSYHALAIAFSSIGAYKLSYQHEKKTFDILAKQVGEDDSKTREAQNWMNKFKMYELQKNAQKLKDQALNEASTRKAIDIFKAQPDLLHALEAAGGSRNLSSSANKSLSAALVGETLPRGRGIDERAARAAAGVRRKAAERGLLRLHGVQVQALPPLPQLPNIMNSSGMTPEAVDNGDAAAVKKEDNDSDNGFPSTDPIDAKNYQSIPVEEQAPVGLGKGLTPLDVKKQTSKSMAGA